MEVALHGYVFKLVLNPEEHLSINENMENLYNKAMEIWNNTLLDGNNYSYYEYKLKEENEVKEK